MRKELVLTSIFFGLLFILVSVFKPIFFLISLIVFMIWFLLARKNGYFALSYLALFLALGLFIAFAPVDKNLSSDSQAKLLAASDLGSSNLVTSKVSGLGSDSTYLVADRNNLDKVVLVRPARQEKESYFLTNQKPQTKYGSSSKEELLNQFKQDNPSYYPFAFFLALLPLVLVAALPKKGFQGNFLNWLLPKNSSNDLVAAPGQAGIQIILILTVAFLIGTLPF